MWFRVRGNFRSFWTSRLWRRHANEDCCPCEETLPFRRKDTCSVFHTAMGPGVSWVRGWTLLALGIILPLTTRCSGLLEEQMGQQGEEEAAQSFGRAFAGGHLEGEASSEGSNFLAGQQPTPSLPAEGTTNMERIVSPTLGPFIPSPEIKFPGPHAMVAPVYGEAKTPPATSSIFDSGDTGLSDVLIPPNQYYPKPAPGYEYEPLTFRDPIPPSRRPGHHLQAHQQHHHPRPLLPLLFTGHGGAKEEDFYVSYDGPEEDDGNSYQFPPHPAHPPYPRPPKMPQPPAASAEESDADLLLSKKSGKVKAWKTLVAALTTLVPIGLFLAALPPNYVTINNSTSSRVGKSEEGAEGRRLDDAEEEYPMLGLMGRYGIAALADPECESRIFCEMSRMGKDSGGNVVQRVFWQVVNDAPDVLTELIGLRKLFKAARTDSCLTFKCKDTRGVEDED